MIATFSMGEWSNTNPHPLPMPHVTRSVRAAALIALCSALHAALPDPVAAQVPRLTPAFTIGCESCGDATEFGEVLDVAVDSSGGVLIINNSAPFLRRFDSGGVWRWSAGVSGSGPGEYRRAIWAIPSGAGVQVVDMTARRVSRLDATGRFVSSAPLRGFPATVAAQANSGAFVVLFDDFRGGYRLERWTAADTGRPHVALPATEPRAPGAIVFTAMAGDRDGTLALARDVNRYRVQIVGPDGTLRRTITRDIPQARRSAEELEALDRIRQRAALRVSSERAAAATRNAPPTPRPSGAPELKPHISIDGLQYDDAGRLWVRTMRGDHTVTVFDLFSPNGSFIGELRVPGRLGSFSLAGPWLAAAFEGEDGVPAVRVYRVAQGGASTQRPR